MATFNSFQDFVINKLQSSGLTVSSLLKHISEMHGLYSCTPNFLSVNKPQSCNKGCQKSSQRFSFYVTALWCIFTQQLGVQC